jgi:hypothetical protein
VRPLGWRRTILIRPISRNECQRVDKGVMTIQQSLQVVPLSREPSVTDTCPWKGEEKHRLRLLPYGNTAVSRSSDDSIMTDGNDCFDVAGVGGHEL